MRSLTYEQQHAITLLRSADPRYNGKGVLYAGRSDLIDRQAWINWRTAAALERCDLVICEDSGDEASVRLLAAPESRATS